MGECARVGGMDGVCQQRYHIEMKCCAATIDQFQHLLYRAFLHVSNKWIQTLRSRNARDSPHAHTINSFTLNKMNELLLFHSKK